MQTSTSLSLEAVQKQFADKMAVDGVSLTVGPGTIYGLLGRNGAGKTTTLRMIAGVFHPDRGRVVLFGGLTGAAARDRLAYLPEERGLYKKMKISDLVMFFAEIKGKPRPQAKALAQTVLERFELWGERERKVEELSKGNQQKVQLATVMVADPDLLLLDEPMSGLDPVNVVLVREILLELRSRGKTVILSTHMMNEAEKLCDEVCLIHQGKVVLSGSVKQVRASRGKSAAHVEFDGDGVDWGRLPGVEAAEVTGRKAELRVAAGTDTNRLLASLLGQVKIHRFEVADPSLEQVFVDTVNPEPEEVRS